MSKASSSSTNLQARPRHSPVVKPLDYEATSIKFEICGTSNQSVELNESATVIWKLCDGTRTLEQLLTLFEEQYPEQGQIRKEVSDQIDQLLNSQLIVLDGGREALEYTGAIIRKVKPTAELLWQLELLRQFIFGISRIEQSTPMNSDLDVLLNDEALLKAKRLDIDSARQNNDSTVVPYKKALHSPSSKACIDSITQELRLLLPNITSPIEISGSSLYPRGAHMGWHSNHSRSDGRIYCSWSEAANSNFFKYEDPITGEVVTHWEDPGWNLKSFTIPAKTSRFWHSIGAQSLRLSLGFRYELPKDQDR